MKADATAFPSAKSARRLTGAATAVALFATGFIASATAMTVQAGAAEGTAADHPPAASAGPKPPSITVVPAVAGTLVEHVVVTGSLRPREEVQVTAEIDGLAVTEVLVEAGDRVRTGQVLARLSQDTTKASIAQTTAQVARAAAAIAQAESQVTEAKATLDQAKRIFDRTSQLAKSGVASKEAYDQRKSDVDVAAARLGAAEEALGAARADKALAEAQLLDARIRLARTEIKATADGTISRRDITVGRVVSASAGPLFLIMENSDIELAADVAETVITKLKVGDRASVLAAGFDKPLEGDVRLISPEVNDRSRLGQVRIDIPDDPALKVGAFARADIETARRDGVIVPLSAVLYTPSGPKVQVVKDGIVETRPVEIGLVSDGKAEIDSGLKPGEQLVSISGTFLRNGDHVTPMPAPSN